MVEGAVRLDAPVREYLDAEQLSTVPPAAREITLLDLATHHSGLPQMPVRRPSKDFRDPFLGYGPEHLYLALRLRGLAVPADAKYQYSNFGYKLLGMALCHVTGRNFADLLADFILMPLGLTETTVDDPPALLQGHDLLGHRTPAWHFEGAMAASGGLRSTSRDVLRYLLACLDPPDEMAEAMALVQRPVHRLAEGGFVALGWHGNGAGAMWHNGALTGFSSFATFDHAARTACVVLVNQFTPPDSIADGVGLNVGRWLGGEPTQPVAGNSPIALKMKHLLLRGLTPIRTLRR